MLLMQIPSQRCHISYYPKGPVSNTALIADLETKNVAEPLRGHRPAVPGGRQAQVLRLQVAIQQLGDAL